MREAGWTLPRHPAGPAFISTQRGLIGASSGPRWGDGGLYCARRFPPQHLTGRGSQSRAGADRSAATGSSRPRAQRSLDGETRSGTRGRERSEPRGGPSAARSDDRRERSDRPGEQLSPEAAPLQPPANTNPKTDPDHPGGIASPDQTQLRSGCPVFRLGLGCLALCYESPAAVTARSYSGTEDVRLQRRFSREIDSGPSVLFRPSL